MSAAALYSRPQVSTYGDVRCGIESDGAVRVDLGVVLDSLRHPARLDQNCNDAGVRYLTGGVHLQRLQVRLQRQCRLLCGMEKIGLTEQCSQRLWILLQGLLVASERLGRVSSLVVAEGQLDTHLRVCGIGEYDLGTGTSGRATCRGDAHAGGAGWLSRTLTPSDRH